MKNELFWVGAFCYFIADLITTSIGLSMGRPELNPFVKTLPFMLFAKAGVLMFLFGVLKYFEHMRIKSGDKLTIETSRRLESFIIVFIAFIGIGIGVINNVLSIGGLI